MNVRQHLASLSMICLTSCAAAFVPITEDPHGKLAWAAALLEVIRPLPAESLIAEAIAIYQKQNDQEGLADGYEAYAELLSSKAVGGWHQWYEAHGFWDETATYANRFERSIQYSEKAAVIYMRHARYDGLTLAYRNIGLSYDYLGRHAAACSALEKSVQHSGDVVLFQPAIKLSPPTKETMSYENLYKQRCG